MDFKFDINKIEADYRAKIVALEEKYSNIPQRQLKFRIWDKYSETFVDNSASLHCFSQWVVDAETGRTYDAIGAIDGDHSDNDQRSLYRDHERFSGPDGAYIIQQWTGLKDKNGKEIFEGDIICFAADKSKYPIGSITFKEFGFRVENWELDQFVMGWCVDFFDGSNPRPLHTKMYRDMVWAQGVLVIGNVLEDISKNER